jgi:hypothetical protein
MDRFRDGNGRARLTQRHFELRGFVDVVRKHSRVVQRFSFLSLAIALLSGRRRSCHAGALITTTLAVISSVSSSSRSYWEPRPRHRLLTRRARNALGTATQCTRRNDSPPPPPPSPPAGRNVRQRLPTLSIECTAATSLMAFPAAKVVKTSARCLDRVGPGGGVC